MNRIFAKQTWKDIFGILKDTAIGFGNDRAIKMSASLSYYTIFSMAPLLLLMISLAGAFYGRDAVQGKVFSEMNGLLGSQAALQVQEIIKNMELSGQTTFSLVVSGLMLIVGATTIFVDIQDSINSIWRVKAKPKRGWVKLIKDRLLSSSIIVGLGFLMIVTLVVNGALAALGDLLRSYFPDVTVILMQILNLGISFIVMTILFGVIFKVLPDAEIRWKDVRVGAFFTACLFMLGRYLISLYIETTGTGSAYGAAGSIIVILVWVYYTAAILYFGAEFTRVYVDYTGARIQPSEFAVYVEQREIEKEVSVLPPR